MKTTALIAICLSLCAAPAFAADITCAYKALTPEQLTRAEAVTKDQINGVPGSSALAKEMSDMAMTATATCPADVRNDEEMVSRASTYIIGKLFVSAIDQTLAASQGAGDVERIWNAMSAEEQKNAVALASPSGEMSIAFVDMTAPILFKSMPSADSRVMAMAGMGLFFRALQTSAMQIEAPAEPAA